MNTQFLIPHDALARLRMLEESVRSSGVSTRTTPDARRAIVARLENEDDVAEISRVAKKENRKDLVFVCTNAPHDLPATNDSHQ